MRVRSASLARRSRLRTVLAGTRVASRDLFDRVVEHVAQRERLGLFRAQREQQLAQARARRACSASAWRARHRPRALAVGVQPSSFGRALLRLLALLLLEHAPQRDAPRVVHHRALAAKRIERAHEPDQALLQQVVAIGMRAAERPPHHVCASRAPPRRAGGARPRGRRVASPRPIRQRVLDRARCDSPAEHLRSIALPSHPCRRCEPDRSTRAEPLRAWVISSHCDFYRDLRTERVTLLPGAE